jgi:hypothetical protein
VSPDSPLYSPAPFLIALNQGSLSPSLLAQHSQTCIMSTSTISRAFTTRRAKGHEASHSNLLPKRSLTTSKSTKNIRGQISAPVELVHTTNMLSYNAPDLPRSSRSNTLSSKDSDDGYEAAGTAHSTPPTSPDIPQEELHPSVEPNHLTSYFAAPGRPAFKGAPIIVTKADPPHVPQRSPSHTKKHSVDTVARKQSMSRISKGSDGTMDSKSSGAFSRSPSMSTHASSVSRSSTQRSHKPMHSPSMSSSERPITFIAPISPAQPVPVSPPAAPQQARHAAASHPFGHELAQVTELAEEFSHKTQGLTEDDEYIRSHGLAKWTPSDYLGEIQSLTSLFFPELHHNVKSTTPMWI